MSFRQQLNDFARKTSARSDAVVKKIVIDVGSALVMKTPVGDPSYWVMPAPPGYVGGRARGNWQYGLNAPVTADRDSIDPSGGGTISAIVGSVSGNAAGKIHYITNTLEYIDALENGRSRQAPHGMMKLTVMEFQPIVRRAASLL